MKRYHAYLLLMMLIIAFVVPFIVPMKEGRPLLDWHTLALPPNTTAVIKQTFTATSEAQHEPVKLMRWRDHNHQWHFSQSAPEDGTPYETIFVDPDNNLVTLPNIEPSPTAEAVPATASNAERSTSPSPYTPAELSQLLQEARNAKELLSERHVQQEIELNGSATQR